ncbi:MAG TPA: HIT domain-containing protein [Acidimicrobiia bacterium]|nr:HIT domain-containing protein [Acidimicrobiia bacterium]
MAHVDQLWAGWRHDYVTKAADDSRDRRAGLDVPECILCELEGKGSDYYVVARNEKCFVVMNLYPYANGHMMVVPNEHNQNLQDFDTDTRNTIIDMTNTASKVLREIYNPDGVNVGINMGEAAGAGIPGHLHVHILPRWNADTNFLTTVANTRVMPETLQSSYEKINNLWPVEEKI